MKYLLIMGMLFSHCSTHKYFKTEVSRIREINGKEQYLFYGVYQFHDWYENLKVGDTVCLETKFYKIKR